MAQQPQQPQQQGVYYNPQQQQQGQAYPQQQQAGYGYPSQQLASPQQPGYSQQSTASGYVPTIPAPQSGYMQPSQQQQPIQQQQNSNPNQYPYYQHPQPAADSLATGMSNMNLAAQVSRGTRFEGN
jgi:hypothetical protein